MTEVKVVTPAAWKKAKTHVVCMPSGVYVEIQIPDLAALIENDRIPQNLLDAALGYVGGNNNEKPTKETIIRDRQFRDTLVSLTVVNPPLKPEDVSDLPTEDKDMLTELALRQRDVDAEGEHIGGLMRSDKFRKFRGITDEQPILEGSSTGW